MGELQVEPKKGIALCLSGGGYRAALYDLGVIRRLDELGILGRVDTVTAVSGGSILAGFLAAHIVRNGIEFPTPDGRVPGLEEGVIQPMRDLAARNIRTRVLLKQFAPWKWLDRSTTAKALAARYEKYVTDMTVDQLPECPNFVILATDMQFGDQWCFERDRVGSKQAGWHEGHEGQWTVAEAMAASCSVPMIFQPLRIKDRASWFQCGQYKDEDRDERARRIDLSDGGVYDNLGLDPVWDTHDVVLVADGSPHFFAVRGKSVALRMVRQMLIVLDQNAYGRQRWLKAQVQRGALRAGWVEITTKPKTVPRHPGYSHELVKGAIAPMRIDLDKFAPAEQAVLENHGYHMIDHVVDAYLADLAVNDAPFQVPHPDWMDEEAVRSALRKSGCWRILGRGRWY